MVQYTTMTIQTFWANFLWSRSLFALIISRDGRVVKALDLKSNGVSPRRFEPCSRRYDVFFNWSILNEMTGISYIMENMLLPKWWMVIAGDYGD